MNKLFKINLFVLALCLQLGVSANMSRFKSLFTGVTSNIQRIITRVTKEKPQEFMHKAQQPIYCEKGDACVCNSNPFLLNSTEVYDSRPLKGSHQNMAKLFNDRILFELKKIYAFLNKNNKTMENLLITANNALLPQANNKYCAHAKRIKPLYSFLTRNPAITQEQVDIASGFLKRYKHPNPENIVAVHGNPKPEFLDPKRLENLELEEECRPVDEFELNNDGHVIYKGKKQ